MCKIIEIMGDTHNITKSYDTCVCAYETKATNTIEPYDTIVIDLGDVVYDFNVLESTSVAFKINKDDENYYVNMFGIMFSPGEEDLTKKLDRIKEIDSEILDLMDEKNKISDSIKRADDLKVSF